MSIGNGSASKSSDECETHCDGLIEMMDEWCGVVEDGSWVDGRGFQITTVKVNPFKRVEKLTCDHVSFEISFNSCQTRQQRQRRREVREHNSETESDDELTLCSLVGRRAKIGRRRRWMHIRINSTGPLLLVFETHFPVRPFHPV